MEARGLFFWVGRVDLGEVRAQEGQGRRRFPPPYPNPCSLAFEIWDLRSKKPHRVGGTLPRDLLEEEELQDYQEI